MNETLQSVYYDPENEGAYGGVKKLHEKLKKEGKRIGIGKVKKWLQGQRTYTLHKQPRRKFERNKILAYDRNELWQADLVDMLSIARENDNFKHLLTVIDVLSKQAYAIPLKAKTYEEVHRAFEQVFHQAGNIRPKLLHTDKGGEFMGAKMQSFFKQNGIKQYVTQNEDIKAAVVERFNRTLKGLMYRWFTYKNTRRYVEVLPKLLKNYNNTWHSSIKMRPSDVTNEDKVVEVYENLYGPEAKDTPKAPSNLKVGDFVRLLFKPDKFRRGYQPQWTEEVFKIDNIRPHRPYPIYSVRDLNGEPVQGTWYAPELQRITEPEMYIIEEVLKTRGRGDRKEYFVSWRGYGPEFNSWVSDIHHGPVS